MRVPAAIAALPLCGGAAAGVLFVDSIPERMILASAAAAVFALVAGCGFLGDGLDWAVVALVGSGCAAAGVSMGASGARAVHAPPLLKWFDIHAGDGSDPLRIEGVLREDAALTEDGAAMTVDVARVAPLGGPFTSAAGGIRLTIAGRVAPADAARWCAGRTVRFPASLRYPGTFRDPGVQDDARALARRGIVLTGTVKSGSLVEILRDGHPLAETAAAARARARGILSARIGRYSARSSAIATAILIGDRTGLSDEDEQRLRDAGTYHVIAISGGNIAIFTAMLMGLARLFRVPLRLAALIAIGVLLFYGEVAGGAASVGRAVAAAVIFLAALVLDHRGSPLNTVSMAGLLGVGVSPVAVLDAGFLLSFGATVGIVLGVPRLMSAPARTKASRIRRLIRALAFSASGLLAATICAEIALAPIGAALFARITAAGLILNFAAIPLMTFVQAGSIVLVLLGTATGQWADPIALAVHASATGLVESAGFVQLAPWLARDVPAPAWWLCAAYYLACGALLQRRTRAALVAFALTAALLVAGHPTSTRGQVAAPAAGTLRVVVLDVGQGDATVAMLPDGTNLLIDTGGLAGTSFDIGGRVVVPALRALGVRQLHALVITHGDPDHVGGAGVVMARFRPSNVWEGVAVPPHEALKVLTVRASEAGAVWRTVRPGDVERAGGVDIRVLHPPPPDWERQRVRNDDSVVLEIRYRDVSIVLPGDIGRDVERLLATSLLLAPVVVLKAAHHGSATSTSEEFLDATQPGAVIFSTGRSNRFKHPAQVVVDRLARRGVEMFNTAHDGAVFVETDGSTVEVRGWTGRKKTFGRVTGAPASHGDTTTRRHD
ncbi:MAG: DNA internalization-related competence protein ComEC/Rec2 [Acidobacteria bacterium]|nr:DNA internalization-related competence protein ComEC/Rec2 [Acidobacteriota bacterium]